MAFLNFCTFSGSFKFPGKFPESIYFILQAIYKELGEKHLMENSGISTDHLKPRVNSLKHQLVDGAR